MSFQKLRDIFLEEDYELDLLIDHANLAENNLTINFRIIRRAVSDQPDDKSVLRGLGHRDSRMTLGNAASALSRIS